MEFDDRARKLYSELPWYRKSEVNSALMIVHLVTFGLLPLLLVTCLALVSGDIYHKQLDEQGNLRTWSLPNKILAYTFLAGPIVLVGAVFSAIAGF